MALEISQKENIIVMWLKWHFFQMPQFLILVWKNYLAFAADFFSVPLLLKTLFYPWRKYTYWPSLFNLGEYFGAFVYNLFSRCIGAVVRLVLIVCGIVVEAVVVVAGLLILAWWILLPFEIILLLVFSFSHI